MASKAHLMGSGFGIILRFLLIVLALSNTAAYSADGNVVNAAKREGEVILYTVMSADNGAVMTEAFQKKYPGITVRNWWGSTESMLSKVLTEARAGALNADVIFSGGSEMQVFKKRGLLQKYVSPEASGIPDDFKDREGYWINVHPLSMVTAYNTDQVKPRDAPQTYEDLLKPQWKGKMSMERLEYDWFATLQKVWGREKALAYCRSLARQDIRFDSGHTKIASLVAAGDIPIGINMYEYRIAALKKEGAKIDWVALDPVVSILEVAAITSVPAHPNAARLFVDFLLSVDGQNLIRSFGRIPGRRGIEPLDKELAKIKPHPTDLATIYKVGLDVFGKEYREIFGLQ
jgi:iron(III) transport system substrate-binding protein